MNEEKQKYSFIKRLKQVPWWGWLAGFLSLVIQAIFYYLSNFLAGAFGFTPISTKVAVIDNAIPIIAVFAIPYVYSYIFWISAGAVASLSGKEQFKKYIIGQLSAYFICFVIYIFMPTYMDRVDEGILEYSKSHWLLKLIYSLDGGKIAFNLFPSYHCLTSTYSYLIVRKNQNIAKWYRVYSLVLSVLIVMSTLFIKQHYFLDALSGVFIAIATYVVVELVSKYNHKTTDLKKEK